MSNKVTATAKPEKTIFGMNSAKIEAEIRKNPTEAARLIAMLEATARKAATLSSDLKAARQSEAAKGKTIFSLANAARRVNMPETSFRRFLSDYKLTGDVSIDGQAAFSEAWLERFAHERGSLEMSYAMKRTKGFETSGREVFESCRQRIITGRFATPPAQAAAPDERTWHEKHAERCARSHFFTNPEAAAFLGVSEATFSAAVKQFRMKPDGSWQGRAMFSEEYLNSLRARIGMESREEVLQRMVKNAAAKKIDSCNP
ncbi:MAG: hypothetical protein NTZ46_11805 [Verrucomicrobia bacterium]|nr:hypothetical protein [Verrucomicrobiota bacterium]